MPDQQHARVSAHADSSASRTSLRIRRANAAAVTLIALQVGELRANRGVGEPAEERHCIADDAAKEVEHGVTTTRCRGGPPWSPPASANGRCPRDRAKCRGPRHRRNASTRRARTLPAATPACSQPAAGAPKRREQHAQQLRAVHLRRRLRTEARHKDNACVNQSVSLPFRHATSNVLPATVGAQGCAPSSPRDGLPACRGKDVRRRVTEGK